MTRPDTDDLDRRASQVLVSCQQIDVALMRRPGALAPGEQRDVLIMLTDMARGCPLVTYAPADRQLLIAESFLDLWTSVLPLGEQADNLWPDPDDQEGH